MKKLLVLVAVLLTVNLALFALDGLNSDAAVDGKQFTGTENHQVTLEEAMRFIEDFRAEANENEPLGGYFGSEAIKEVLAQDGVVGLRYYYGKNDGQRNVVLVGTDAAGNDVWGGKLAEYSVPCPPWCAPGDLPIIQVP